MQNSSRMVRHALMMMMGTLISRILGLAREVVTAAFFGVTGQLDAFNVAYTLANLARQLVAEGALSAAFVPVFSKALAQSHARALSLARQAMSVLILASSVITLVGIIGAPLLTFIMAPGFDPASARLATSLTRWMFPFLFLVSLAALAMGTLNSLGSFFVPALAPAFSNLTFILLAPILVRYMGIHGLALAVLAGGAMHFITQWFWSRRIGATLVPERPLFDDPDLKRMMLLFIPYAAGLSLNQLNPVISRMLGSFLEEGSISVLNYANRIVQFPLGLFVIAISQAVLPQLSRAADAEHFSASISEALRFALFIVLPATLGFIMISNPFVHLIFVRGAFDAHAWETTSRALLLSMLGLPGMACSTVVMRGLYALALPRGAFLTTLFSVLSTALLSIALMFPLGYQGLALAPSIAFSLSGFLGLYFIRKHLRHPLRIFSMKWVWKIGVALCFMGLFLTLYIHSIPYSPHSSLSMRIAWNLGSVFVGMISYSLTTLFLGCDEWHWIKDALNRKI